MLARYILWMVIAAMAFGLSSCGSLCSGRSPLEVAAQSSRGHTPNVWMKNPDLEWFLSPKVEADGVATLSSRYGFQCSPASTPNACPDCYSCSTVVPQRVDDMGIISHCTNIGTMQIHAEVGPRKAVSVMTYWKPDPGKTWPN
jgi:hypothetical protein